ncbi:MAG: hypothetical protein LBL49_00775 [Clostridiales Family XIII bacterium]|nr:hypothetical protein [Clostridiales Family XIII bacterium]
MNEKVGCIIVKALFLILGLPFGWIICFVAWYSSGLFAGILHYIIIISDIGLTASGYVFDVYIGIIVGVIGLLICLLIKKSSHFDCSVEMFFVMVFYVLLFLYADAHSSGGFISGFELMLAKWYFYGAITFAVIKILTYVISITILGKKNNPRMSFFLITVLTGWIIFAAFGAPLYLVLKPSVHMPVLAGVLICTASLTLCLLLKKRLCFEPSLEIISVMLMYGGGVLSYELYFRESLIPFMPKFALTYCYIWALVFYVFARLIIKAGDFIANEF